MKKKVLIPHRGVIALDIINSLNSIGLETLLLHSPEDSLSLPVKLADKSYKFLSSKLEDSYLDMEAIIEKAVELQVDYIHPGYGFLSENPEFAKLCKDNDILFIGPDFEILKIVQDKNKLCEIAENLNIKTVKRSIIIKEQAEIDSAIKGFNFPVIIKSNIGYGGKGIKVSNHVGDVSDKIINMLRHDSNRKHGIIIEEFLPFSHSVEIPFFRDIKGNILFLPEIEASIQRRFQKVFQESPSVNLIPELRKRMYSDSQKIIENINYSGFGYIEFLLDKTNEIIYFAEINPTFQINTLIPEVHEISNFIKKQFAISKGELLHNVNGVRIVEPQYHVILASLMAENPYNDFVPSSGVITDFFHYSTIRNIFKTNLYHGAKISPLYDPYIGKILTFSKKRENALKDMKIFLDNIVIGGIQTNLTFLKHMLENKSLSLGNTIIDFINLKCDFSKRIKSEEDLSIAVALMSSVFHLENRKKNYKSQLEKMKQPGFFKRLINRF
jgi:acetyl-CoA carboxylase biotin carboxylase subunit